MLNALASSDITAGFFFFSGLRSSISRCGGLLGAGLLIIWCFEVGADCFGIIRDAVGSRETFLCCSASRCCLGSDDIGLEDGLWELWRELFPAELEGFLSNAVLEGKGLDVDTDLAGPTPWPLLLICLL